MYKIIIMNSRNIAVYKLCQKISLCTPNVHSDIIGIENVSKLVKKLDIFCVDTPGCFEDPIMSFFTNFTENMQSLTSICRNVYAWIGLIFIETTY